MGASWHDNERDLLEGATAAIFGDAEAPGGTPQMWRLQPAGDPSPPPIDVLAVFDDYGVATGTDEVLQEYSYEQAGKRLEIRKETGLRRDQLPQGQDGRFGTASIGGTLYVISAITEDRNNIFLRLGGPRG